MLTSSKNWHFLKSHKTKSPARLSVAQVSSSLDKRIADGINVECLHELLSIESHIALLLIKKMKPLLITGTDTEVGKTVLTTALVAYWQKYASLKTLGLMKLLQAGIGDRELYMALFALEQPPETVSPLCFETPVAPPIAAEIEGREIDLTPVWQAYQQLQQAKKLVIVEALGGLGSPVTAELTVADIGSAWKMRSLLVVPVKLGAISQAVANVALARQVKLEVMGIILNCPEKVTPEQQKNWTPVNLIESLTHVPILGTIPYLSDVEDTDKLAQVAANLSVCDIL